VRVRHRHTETGALATHIAHGSHGGSLPERNRSQTAGQTAPASRPSRSLTAPAPGRERAPRIGRRTQLCHSARIPSARAAGAG
jgi:hypothetical protein